MKSSLVLITPHARQILDGVAQTPRPYNRTYRIVADDGATLVLTYHDEYVASHEFDLVASTGLTAADLREVHDYIVANVIIPTANA